MASLAGKNPSAGGKIITINEGEVKGYLNTVVKDVVEETLNGMLDAEADELCKASNITTSLMYWHICHRLPIAAAFYQRCTHFLRCLTSFERI